MSTFLALTFYVDTGERCIWCKLPTTVSNVCITYEHESTVQSPRVFLHKPTEVSRRSGSRASVVQRHFSRVGVAPRETFSWYGVKSWFVDPFWVLIYDLNIICETEKPQSITAFSFYSTINLMFHSKRPIAEIYFSRCAICHFVRAGVSFSICGSPFSPMAEISSWSASFWSA